jgi:hypothetical protein
LRESDHEAFVGEHMLKDAGEKARLARCFADTIALESRDGEKAIESVRFLGDKGKRLNCKHFRGFSRIS